MVSSRHALNVRRKDADKPLVYFDENFPSALSVSRIYFRFKKRAGRSKNRPGKMLRMFYYFLLSYITTVQATVIQAIHVSINRKHTQRID